MIRACCTTCGADGPHQVLRDYGAAVLAVCTDCGNGFMIQLDTMPVRRVDSA